jgi:hypothetical protein
LLPGRRVLALVIAYAGSVFIFCGCTDFAESDYNKCVAAEKAKDLGTAWDACTKASLMAESRAQQLAKDKLESMASDYADWQTERMTVATFTEAWCDTLMGQLSRRYQVSLGVEQAIKPPSSRIPPEVIASAVHDNVQNQIVNCKEDAFEHRNIDYWKCVWRSDHEGPKTCPKSK